MLKNIMNVKVNYKFIDNDFTKTLVFLHGWGQNIEMMEPIGNSFTNSYNVLYIDLPGFGKSSEPVYVWSISDYASCINKIIKDLKIANPIIVGHSFGGRIALIYASLYETDKLICLASPFCKEITKLPLKNRIYKRLKNTPGLKWLANILKNHVGSTDYKNASEILRGILVTSINLEMTEDIKKIKCPTLLIWGDKDTAVPIKRAYELKELIKDSNLVVYKGATHYAYLEKRDEVIKEIKSFID